MKIQISSISFSAISMCWLNSIIYESRFQKMRLELKPKEHLLFGFLLESIDGLATHTRLKGTDVLEVSVSPDQMEVFKSFVRSWSDWISMQTGNGASVEG